MHTIESLAAVRELGRNVFKDTWTLRLFGALVACDVAFIGVVAAKAFGLIWFHAGVGNVIIAGQLVLVAVVLLSGWWHYRNAALASLAMVAILLAVEKSFKFHNVLGVRLGEALAPIGLGIGIGQAIGFSAYLLGLGAVGFMTLMIGWRRSDRAGRAAILLLSTGFGIMAGTSIIADSAGTVLRILLSIDRDALARVEQGLELFTVSMVLVLAVGVVRVGWQK
jgi:hypothetical protein